MNQGFAPTAPGRTTAVPRRLRATEAARVVAALTLACVIALALATGATPVTERGRDVTDGWLHSGVTSATTDPSGMATDGWLHSILAPDREEATIVTDGWLHSGVTLPASAAADSD